MNKTHCLIWSEVCQTWIVAHEAAVARGKPASRRKRLLTALAGALLAQSALAQTPAPTALPTGGSVVAGQAAIAQSGSQMTVTQSTDKAILNWQSFNIGSQAGVTFQQPSASAVALNRVLGSDPSAIYGSLKANGQVFLINPNGVLFGQGARVNVGGLVASTLNLRNDDFLAGNNRFTRDGATAGVTNQGELLGKYVALLAPEVKNEGVIATRLGTAALAAGEAVTLGISGNALIDVQVEQASIDTLVENKHLVKADAGTVVLSAQSAHTLLGQVVNTGAIEAKGIDSSGGTVRLLASSEIDHSGSITADAGANGNGGTAILLANLANPNSQTTVSGSITARGGSASGDGGFVETSGTHLKITDTVSIDTSAVHGKAGTWLLDPDDFTIAASGGDLTGATLGTLLASNNVTIQTTGTTSSCATDAPASCGSGATGTGNGDIFVNDTVSWASASTLTLDAWRNIEVNQAISVTGTGGLTLKYGQQAGNSGNTAAYLLSKPINLASGATFQTQLGNDVGVTSYTIVNNRAALDTVASGTNYVLGDNITAGATAFTPISSFTNVFDGLGHTIGGLIIDTAFSNNSGLFAEVGGYSFFSGITYGEVRNLGLTNVSVTGTASWMGGIAGTNWGSIHHSYVTGNVGSAGGAGTMQTLGGLVGGNNGSIASSYSGATVTGANGDNDAVVGGLAGVNTKNSGGAGSIANSYATGTVSKVSGATTGAIGGLVGSNEAGGSISNSYSRGSVSAGTSTRKGGLVGMNGNNDSGTDSTITNSYYSSTTSGQATGIGDDVSATPQTVTAKTTAELTVASVLADLGLSSVTWLRDSTTGYPVLRGIVYSASGAPTVVYIRLVPNSSTYGDAVNLTYGLFSAATAGTTITDASPSGTVSWTGTVPTSTSNVNSYSLTYSSGITLGNAGYSLAAGDAASWTINPRTVTLTASKTYDGTTALTGAQVTIGNTVGTQTLTYTGATATASDAHVATLSKYISAITLANGSNGGLASNYQLPAFAYHATNNAVTINAKALNVTAPTISAVSKTYDGLLAATGSSLTGGGVSGFVGSDTGNLNTSAITLAYNSAHAAAATTVAATGAATLNFTGTAAGSGDGTTGNEVAGQATDYSFSAPAISSVAGTINAKQLTATASITAAAKTYDGLLAATGSTVSGDLSGELNGDSITLDTSGLSLAFNDAHVATAGKTISASGNVALGTLTAGGSGSKDGTAGNAVAGALGDYVLAAQPTISSVAGTITPKTLTASLSNTGVGKPYDGTATTSATASYSVSGLVDAAESATLSSTGLAYDSAHVADADHLVASGVSLTGISGGALGSQLSDYSLNGVTTAQSAAGSATITAKALDLLGLTVARAEVDATTATLGGTAALKPAITAGTGTASDGTPYSDDAVQLGGTAVGTIPAPVSTVGASVTVNVSGLALSGNEASNYTLKTPQATLTGTSVSASIEPSVPPSTVETIYKTVAEARDAAKRLEGGGQNTGGTKSQDGSPISTANIDVVVGGLQTPKSNSTSQSTGPVAVLSKAAADAKNVADKAATNTKAKIEAAAKAAADAKLAKDAAAADPASKEKAADSKNAEKRAEEAKATADQAMADQVVAEKAAAEKKAEAEASTLKPKDRSETIDKLVEAVKAKMEAFAFGFGGAFANTNAMSEADKKDFEANRKRIGEAHQKAEVVLKDVDEETLNRVASLAQDRYEVEKAAADAKTAAKAAADARAAAKAAADKAAASKAAADKAAAAAEADPASNEKAMAARNAALQASKDKLAGREAEMAASDAETEATDKAAAVPTAQLKAKATEAKVTAYLSEQEKAAVDKTAADKAGAAGVAAFNAALAGAFSGFAQGGASGSAAAADKATAGAKQAADKVEAAKTAAANAQAAADQAAANAKAAAADAPKKAAIIAQLEHLKRLLKSLSAQQAANHVQGAHVGAAKAAFGAATDALNNADSSDLATLQKQLDSVKATAANGLATKAEHTSYNNATFDKDKFRVDRDSDRTYLDTSYSLEQGLRPIALDKIASDAALDEARTAAAQATAKAAAAQATAKAAEAKAALAQAEADAAAQQAVDAESAKKAAALQVLAKNLAAAAVVAKATAEQAAAEKVAADAEAENAAADSAAANLAVKKEEAALAANAKANAQRELAAAQATVTQKAEWAQEAAKDADAAKATADKAKTTAEQAKAAATQAVADKAKWEKAAADKAAEIPLKAKAAEEDKAAYNAAKSKLDASKDAADKALEEANAATEETNKLGAAIAKAKGALFQARVGAAGGQSNFQLAENLIKGDGFFKPLDDVKAAEADLAEAQAEYDAAKKITDTKRAAFLAAEALEAENVKLVNAAAEKGNKSATAAEQAKLDKAAADQNVASFTKHVKETADYAKATADYANATANYAVEVQMDAARVAGVAEAAKDGIKDMTKRAADATDAADKAEAAVKVAQQ